jgi:hypothetical protein
MENIKLKTKESTPKVYALLLRNKNEVSSSTTLYVDIHHSLDEAFSTAVRQLSATEEFGRLSTTLEMWVTLDGEIAVKKLATFKGVGLPLFEETKPLESVDVIMENIQGEKNKLMIRLIEEKNIEKTNKMGTILSPMERKFIKEAIELQSNKII